MSNDTIKRPLRLLSGYADPGARLPRANTFDDLECSAEWFHRVLLGGRDAKPDTPDAHEIRPAKTLGRDTANATPEATPAPRSESPSTTISATTQAPSTEPVSGNRAVGERPPAANEEASPRHRPAQPKQHQQHGSDQQAEDRWADHMASLVDQLCNRADPAFKSWTATLRMDPAILPETQLRLSLSPHWLSLRFITDSAAATSLVSSHRTELQSLLERAPNLPHGIDIDIA